MPTKKDITDALLYQKTELEVELEEMSREVIRLNTKMQQHRKQLDFIRLTLEDKDE